MPKVSICIPTYNNAGEVLYLLQSIAEQDYTDYEILINDDSDNQEIASTIQHIKENPVNCQELQGINKLDDTAKVNYAGTIDYIHNPQKLGHIFNWNAPMKRAKGEYIKIMFSDDWFTYETSLTEYVMLLDNYPEADFAFANSMQVSEKNSHVRDISEEFEALLQEDYRHLFLGNEVGAPSGTIFRNKGILFDEKSNWASDLIFYFRILHQNPRFAMTERPLISIGLHEEQYTHMFSEKDDRIFNDYYYLYRLYHLEENVRCKEFFLNEYLMKFDKGITIAKKCGISAGRYYRTKAAYLWQNKVVDYANTAYRKIVKVKNS